MSQKVELDSDASGSEIEGETVDAKTLANRKKKEKKKAAAAKAKAAAGGPVVAEAAEAAETETAAPKAKAKAKPLSAAARLAQERLEAVRRLEEERKRQEEEAKRQAEEEERRYQEQLRQEEEEKEKKRQAKLAKKERLRAEGKLLTKAERERRVKGDILRKQMEDAGLVPRKEELEAGEEVAEAAQAARKIVYETKKKKQQSKTAAAAAAAAAGNEDDDEDAVQEAGASAGVKAGANWEDLLSSSSEEEEQQQPPPQRQQKSRSPSPKKKATEAAASEQEAANPWNVESRFRSPISAVLGHVDAGKTSLMDKIRNTSVQHGEAGGITQQIGATFIPRTNLEQSIDKVQRKSLDVEIPGLLVIDTPGHESFHNLRDRGSSVCDLAVLVVDILSGLEPQTVESLELLRKRRVPFVVAMNKVDRLYSWKAVKDRSIREALKAQKDSVVSEFKDRWAKIHLQFAEKGINVALYWENKDVKHDVSVIPTSAITGEGIPDLLFCLTKLNQQLLAPRITWQPELQCSVLEVKALEGMGTTIDVVLVNGRLHEGDRIVVAGLHGPIVTTIRALLTPKPLREMRVKGEFVHHKSIRGAIGVKISAVGLEDALAGTRLLVASEEASEEEIERLKTEVKNEVEAVLGKSGSGEGGSLLQHGKTGEGGVYVAASTLGSLEALLSFLTDMKVPVSQVSIGELHRSHIRKAALMLDKKKEYAVILAFDVKVSAEAKKEADELGVKIFSADIIYHLFDMFTKYMDGVRKTQREAASGQAVFPVRLKVVPQYIFNKKDPIILGVDVVEGVLKVGTPIVAHAPGKALVEVGKVVGIEKEHKAVDKALNGDSVAVKIAPNGGESVNTAFGRHFDASYELLSEISRPSIETLKVHFKDQMRREDWLLVIKLKSIFDIQ